MMEKIDRDSLSLSKCDKGLNIVIDEILDKVNELVEESNELRERWDKREEAIRKLAKQIKQDLYGNKDKLKNEHN